MDDGLDCARQVEPCHGVDEKNRARQAARRLFHGAARGVQDVERVDLPRPHPGGARVQAVLQNQRVQRFPPFFCEFFGIVHARHPAARLHGHAGGHHRPGQRASAHFIDARDRRARLEQRLFPFQQARELCFFRFPHGYGRSKVILPTLPARNSSSTTAAARSVFSRPPESK